MVMHLYLPIEVQARRVSGHVFAGVTSQESEWSCTCMLGVQARRVSDHVFVC